MDPIVAGSPLQWGAFFALIVGLLERAHRHYAQQPHLPLGADATNDADFQRVLHDLDARS